MPVAKFITRVQRSRLKSLFHFTDTRNLPSIDKHGLLSWTEIQGLRIQNTPGGNELSHQLDRGRGLDGYVHLCLCNEHGMAHRAKEDGRLGTVHWIRVDPAVAALDGVLMTNDNAAMNGVEALPIAEMLPTLDLDTLYSYFDWKDSAVQARRNAAKRYEILVPHMIARDYLTF